jgi:MerR family transcriptional regulator, light-induced transcriptional regulator
MQPPTEHLPIRTVSSLTGVSALTLRAWERRYGLVRPLRTPKGHRLYTHEHVELIRRVVALTERGIAISRVREALEAGAPEASAKRLADPWRDRLDLMAASVARFDERELDRLYDEALSIHPIENVTRRLLLPLLARLGERWQGLPGAIAEEHFFAMYMRSKLGARLLHRVRHAEGPRLLAACGPGEHHEIGLLLFCIEAGSVGMRPVVLGADTPLAELAAAQRRAACDAIVVSSSIDPAPGVLERELPSLVKAAGIPVFVGGRVAARHRAAIAAAGAIAVGADTQDGVRLIRARLDPSTAKRP